MSQPQDPHGQHQHAKADANDPDDVRDVHDVVEAAIGGMPVSTAIAGRARFSINVRYPADRRSDRW